MNLIWAYWESYGHDKNGELHLIDPDQAGTSQAALCDEAPPVGWVWDPIEGPSDLPCCLTCQRERALLQKGRIIRHRARKLRLVKGGLG